MSELGLKANQSRLDREKAIRDAELCQGIIAKAVNLDEHPNLAVGIINREVRDLMDIIRGLVAKAASVAAQEAKRENLQERGIADLITFLNRRQEQCKEFDTPLMCETTELYIRSRLADLFRELSGLERIYTIPLGD